MAPISKETDGHWGRGSPMVVVSHSHEMRKAVLSCGEAKGTALRQAKVNPRNQRHFEYKIR